jgi:signal peptidase I
MRQLLRFLVWTAIAFGFVVAIARLVAIRWWRVPEGDPWLEASIGPTLKGGDLILLWRATKPGIGDLVVCPEPGAPERIVVGRIAGKGGDAVTLRASTVLRNRHVTRTERACLVSEFEVRDPKTGKQAKQLCQMEDMFGVVHMRGSVAANAPKRPDKIFKVPAGHYFLVSDNRQYPYDSRDFGAVERAACKETVVFRLWSRAGFFDEESRFTVVR